MVQKNWDYNKSIYFLAITKKKHSFLSASLI